MDYLELNNRRTGEILRMRRTRDAAGQPVLLLEGSLPPRAEGPPLHVHFLEDESGTVVSGTLGAELAGRTLTFTAGSVVELPKGVPHRWWNAGDTLLQFNGQIAPVVDLDRYLQAIFAVLSANPAKRPSLFYLAHVAWRHRRTQQLALPPPAIQRVLFPIVIALGHLLGKYRGEAWPGSPASCPGAPIVESTFTGAA
jgi:mannose-6-phosphate isomerase-like protein (cupin superfamily)